MHKNIALLTIFAALFLIVSLGQAGSRDCKTLLTSECVGCHEKEKFCENLGKNERFWKAMLGIMEANGADLTKEEKEELIASLSKPLEAAKEVCK